MSTPNNADQWAFETKQVHVGQERPDPATGALSVPIYQSTSYVFDSAANAADRFELKAEGNIYGRLTSPTQGVFEKRIAALEGGSGALALASGAAAITYTFQALAQQGDHILSAKTIYGGTYNLLAHTFKRQGIEASFVDSDDPENFRKAIQPNTKAIFIESMGNPHSNLADFKAIADIAHAHSIPLVVDNTFATPYFFRPIEHGADIVVHSATKFLDGHGSTMGGVIVDGGCFDWVASGKFPNIADPDPSYHGLSFVQAAGNQALVSYVRAILLRDMGACISPFNAFLLLRGLETLSLRVERQAQNALKIVEFLNAHPQVEKVHHPSLESSGDKKLYARYFPNGGGSIFTIEIKGDKQQTMAFIDRLQIFSLVANVADVKSLVIHPATTTHGQLNAQEQEEQGIKPNTVRLSIGIERVEDLIADLQQAFEG